MAVLPVGIGPVTGGYNIERSLRFNSADSAYLSRTPASAGNRKTYTISFWLKRGSISSRQFIFGNADASALNGIYCGFQTNTGEGGNGDSFIFAEYGTSSYTYYLHTTQLFRDPSAWYHIVIAVDTSQATNTNRIKIYVNGSQVTVFSESAYPTQNLDTAWNSTQACGIGRIGQYNSLYLNAYLTEFYNIDGQALTPSSFGETDPNTGVWKPKKYTGTYGTNGFYLPFNPNPSTATSFTADFLVIGGGGGGGGGATNSGGPGGGGAGGYRTSAGTSGGGASAESALTLSTGTAYTVTVGAGGSSGAVNGFGGDGGNSVFATITSTGGGGGAASGNSAGRSGGSGGGGSYLGAGSGTTNQGYAGGAGTYPTSNDGAGGGGAGQAGASPLTNTGGKGGDGVASSITGSSVTRAGGGGGGSFGGTAGDGGSGGGGAGGINSSSGVGTAGTVNTGSGGGGGYTGGQGGSGVVIIKVPDTRSANFTSGVTYSLSTSVSGFKIYTVTATSTTSEKVTFI